MRGMRDWQIAGVATAFAILFAITISEMRRWLPERGRLKFALVFSAGAALVGALHYAELPPAWFDGEREAFVLAATFLLGGFVAQKEGRRVFGLPLLTGMGGALVVLNVLAHV